MEAVETLRAVARRAARPAVAELLRGSGKMTRQQPGLVLQEAEWLVRRPGLDEEALTVLARKAGEGRLKNAGDDETIARGVQPAREPARKGCGRNTMSWRRRWVVLVPGEVAWVERRTREILEEVGDGSEIHFTVIPGRERYHAVVEDGVHDSSPEVLLAAHFSLECEEPVYAIEGMGQGN